MPFLIAVLVIDIVTLLDSMTCWPSPSVVSCSSYGVVTIHDEHYSHNMWGLDAPTAAQFVEKTLNMS